MDSCGFDNGEEPLENSEILRIIDTSQQYSCYTQCFSAEQAARLPEHKSWNHQIPFRDPKAKIPTGAIYKTTWRKTKPLEVLTSAYHNREGSTFSLHCRCTNPLRMYKERIPQTLRWRQTSELSYNTKQVPSTTQQWVAWQDKGGKVVYHIRPKE